MSMQMDLPDLGGGSVPEKEKITSSTAGVSKFHTNEIGECAIKIGFTRTLLAKSTLIWTCFAVVVQQLPSA